MIDIIISSSGTAPGWRQGIEASKTRRTRQAYEDALAANRRIITVLQDVIR